MARTKKVKRCIRELLRDNPDIEWTPRQLYYRLVSPPYEINPVYNGHDRLDEQIMRLRESGEVPDDTIVDSGCRIIGGDVIDWDEESYFEARVAQFMDSVKGYTRSLWKSQSVNPIVVLEKVTLSWLVGQITERYRVPLAVGGDLSSLTQARQVMNALDRSQDNVVLYLGDLDPVGLGIERSLVERLRKMNKGPGMRLSFRRVALTLDQAQSLPHNPTMEVNPQEWEYIRNYGDRCWELDALPPWDLQAMVANAITSVINRYQWNADLNELARSRSDLEARFEQTWARLLNPPDG